MAAQAPRKHRRGSWLAIGAGLAFVVVAVFGFATLGPSGKQHPWRLDAQRVADLQALARDINGYFLANHVLPGSLSDLPGDGTHRVSPESGAPYEYAPTSPDTFRVCATFDTDTDAERPGDFGWAARDPAWSHRAGRQCFERAARRD